MRTQRIPTDETLRSLLANGGPEFPCAAYLDEISSDGESGIDWHWHEEVEFSLVLQGTVECFDGVSVHVLSAGDGLFINSGALHRFSSREGGAMLNLLFAPELIAPRSSPMFREYVEWVLESDCTLHPFLRDTPGHDSLLARAAELRSEAEEGDRFAIRNRICLLWEVLLPFLKSAGTQRPVDRLLRARMQKMVHFIRNNHGRGLKLEEIAAAANISVSQALRCFRQSMETTPIRYLNQYRLEQAKKLLLITPDSVTTISMTVGFESPGYFCRLFRRRYGHSPGEYRRLQS